MEKFYYLYQITNLINEKIYIGVHQTYNLDDGYMGSGTYLKRAFKKHGKKHFVKKILRKFDNVADMYLSEAEIVDTDFVKREDTYNSTEGGYVGLQAQERGHRKQKWLRENDPIWNAAADERSKQHVAKAKIKSLVKQSELRSTDKLWRDGELKRMSVCNIKAGSESANLKRKATMQSNGHAKGNKNSQFGSMWITDGKINKKVSKEDTIPNNWKKGRILNKK